MANFKLNGNIVAELFLVARDDLHWFSIAIIKLHNNREPGDEVA